MLPAKGFVDRIKKKHFILILSPTKCSAYYVVISSWRWLCVTPKLWSCEGIPQSRARLHVSSTNTTYAHSAMFLSSSGLKIRDEILLLNGKPASALRMDDLRAAFVSSALSLSVSTLPELDPRASCFVPPRRSDWEQDPTTDIFSQNQGERAGPF